MEGGLKAGAATLGSLWGSVRAAASAGMSPRPGAGAVGAGVAAAAGGGDGGGQQDQRWHQPASPRDTAATSWLTAGARPPVAQVDGGKLNKLRQEQ